MLNDTLTWVSYLMSWSTDLKNGSGSVGQWITLDTLDLNWTFSTIESMKWSTVACHKQNILALFSPSKKFNYCKHL